MGKFRIQSHGRLQEWVAVEKGYFRMGCRSFSYRA